jgi:hypothetical protein
VNAAGTKLRNQIGKSSASPDFLGMNGYPQLLQENDGLILEIVSRLLPFRSFPINYVLIAPPFVAIQHLVWATNDVVTPLDFGTVHF